MAEASHEPSSSAAQSCSAPPNGTSTGLSGPSLDRRALPRDQHRDVARGPFEQHADLAERHALADQAPASLDQHQVDGLALDDVREIAAGVAGGQRDAPREDALGGQALARLRDRLRGLLELQVLGLQPAAHAGAARRLDEPGDDQLARRLGARQRLGQLDQVLERGVGLRGDEDRALGHAAAPGCSRAACGGRAGELVLDLGAPYSLRGSSSFSSGPAISVVTSAMITSAANSTLEIAPTSSARLSTISSVSPRVFISVPITAEARQSKPAHARRDRRTGELADDREPDQRQR